MNIYLSHRITSTPQHDIKDHCRIAIEFAKQLRHHFPSVDFYVPAESEPFVSRVYGKDMLTLTQILDLDCQIIKEDCQGVIFLCTEGSLSSGQMVELTCCREHSKPFVLTGGDMDRIADFLRQVNCMNITPPTPLI